MIWLIALPIALLVWWIIGCGVLAAIDKDGRLLAWVKSWPMWGWFFAVTFWPVVVYKTLTDKSDASA